MLKKGTIYLLSVGLMQTCVMPAFAEETTLNFTEDQIIEITKGQEVKVDYKKVEDVCETEKAFYVYMSSVQAIIIPKRVLDQDKEKKLRQILSKKYNTSKHGFKKQDFETMFFHILKILIKLTYLIFKVYLTQPQTIRRYVRWLALNPCRQESLHPKRLPNEFNKIIQWKTGRFQNLSIPAEDV